jgi:hypothetical protein
VAREDTDRGVKIKRNVSLSLSKAVKFERVSMTVLRQAQHDSASTSSA